MTRKRCRRASSTKCLIFVAVLMCLVAWVRSRRSALWIRSSVCHGYAMPASKRGIYTLRGETISYSSEAGFCLCKQRFTTAHRACPKTPVDCARECKLANGIHRHRARTSNAPLVECKKLLRSRRPRGEILHLFRELKSAVEKPRMHYLHLPGLRKKISDDYVA